jgi:hypothetical protein
MPNNNSRDKRGLASADKRTKERVARAGGQAYHKKRGEHGSDSSSQSSKNQNQSQDNQ